MIAAGDTGALVGHRYALRELLTWIALALFFAGVAVRMWPGAAVGRAPAAMAPAAVGPRSAPACAPVGRQSTSPPRSSGPCRASEKTSSSASVLVSAGTWWTPAAAHAASVSARNRA